MSDYTFCFLNNIYVTDDKNYYGLIYSNRLFTKIGWSVVDMEHLVNERKKDYIFDFSIENGLLKSFEVDRVQGIDVVGSMINKGIDDCELDQNANIYTLFSKGLENNWHFIDYVGDEEIRTPFSSIRFSKSTMTVYYLIVTKDNKLLNRTIIKDKDGTLTVSKFTFESNEYVNGYCTLEFIKQTEGGYRYNVPVIGIYQSCNFISHPLINKSATLLNRTSTIIAILKCFKKSFISSLGVEDNTDLEWIGGTHSAPKNGVFFKTSNQVVTEDGACKCIEYLINETDMSADRELAIKQVNESSYSDDVKIALRAILKNINKSSVADNLAMLNSMLTFYTKYNVYCAMYLYTIRSLVFFKKQNILPRLNGDGSIRPPVISGGDERTYTIVKEVY